jgi:hypothetical protein
MRCFQFRCTGTYDPGSANTFYVQGDPPEVNITDAVITNAYLSAEEKKRVMKEFWDYIEDNYSEIVSEVDYQLFPPCDEDYGGYDDEVDYD